MFCLSVLCSTFIVKCSWDGLPEGRNSFCVWNWIIIIIIIEIWNLIIIRN